MKLKTGQYSENFWDHEFSFVKPEPILLTILERLRVKTKNSIHITNGPRTVEQHINLYKKLESLAKLRGKKWYEAIPWGSRHLPAFGKKLRAVDINALKPGKKMGRDNSLYLGEDLYIYLREIEKEMNINLGVGIGRTFCHIDIDRKQPTSWYYGY